MPSVRGRDSSVSVVTRLWAGRSGDRILAVGLFPSCVQNGPLAHPAPIKWVPGHLGGPSSRSVALTTPSNAEVKEKVKLYINSPSMPSYHVTGRTLPLIA